MRFVCADVNTVNALRCSKRHRDPSEEVASVHFQTNSRVVHLWWEREQPWIQPKQPSHSPGMLCFLGQKYQKHADYKTVATSHKINVKSVKFPLAFLAFWLILWGFLCEKNPKNHKKRLKAYKLNWFRPEEMSVYTDPSYMGLMPQNYWQHNSKHHQQYLTMNHCLSNSLLTSLLRVICLAARNKWQNPDKNYLRGWWVNTWRLYVS